MTFVNSFFAVDQKHFGWPAIVLHYHSQNESMATTKTIAIVGATGKMGATISRSLGEAKYKLVLMANNKSKLSSLRDELRQINGSDVRTVSDPRTAAWEADIVILAVPAEAEMAVAESIQEVVSGKIIISVSGRINCAGDISAAEELQRKLSNSKVVKVFNTAFVATFIAPAVSCKAAEIFIAGNNGEAVSIVADLSRSTGFSPLVVGDLTASRALERMGLSQIRKSGPKIL